VAETPYTLIAELTYRCPLGCVYCSNPVDARRHTDELSTTDWQRVLDEAEALGVVQVHFTGGEPLVREDLEDLVRQARARELYTNLITSGVPLERSRLDALARAGLDHVQLSFQGRTEEATTRWARHPGFSRKVEVARWVKEAALPLTINIVLHRGNLDEVESLVEFAAEHGADRLELANTQYLGFALENRAALMPTRAQIDHAREVVASARQRYGTRMEIDFVVPDYHVDRPRACMDGWARRYIVVSPDGLVLPCHAAHTIPGLDFESIRHASLGDAWERSTALERFRGEAWMPEPCRGCEHRHADFGGCRCQAFHLTGNAGAVDPTCALSPDHGIVEAARRGTDAPAALVPLRYRRL
jgi:pyrroloquinoline quinone biosynthesis protein E